MLRSFFAFGIILILTSCNSANHIPLTIKTLRSENGSVLVEYKILSERDICVSKISITANGLSVFPEDRKQKVVLKSKMGRKFIDFQYFSDKNLAEIEAWRGSGLTLIEGSREIEEFELLIQASYCDDVFSKKEEVDIFEYFEIFK